MIGVWRSVRSIAPYPSYAQVSPMKVLDIPNCGRAHCVHGLPSSAASAVAHTGTNPDWHSSMRHCVNHFGAGFADRAIRLIKTFPAITVLQLFRPEDRGMPCRSTWTQRRHPTKSVRVATRHAVLPRYKASALAWTAGIRARQPLIWINIRRQRIGLFCSTRSWRRNARLHHQPKREIKP